MEKLAPEPEMEAPVRVTGLPSRVRVRSAMSKPETELENWILAEATGLFLGEVMEEKEAESSDWLMDQEEEALEIRRLEAASEIPEPLAFRVRM